MHKHVIGAALLTATLLVNNPILAGESKVDTGRLLVLENCARCHAVAGNGDSPLAEAPPFRRLHERYDIDDLAEALAEGITVGHKEMPPFSFDPPQIDALLAYLKSLAPRTGR